MISAHEIVSDKVSASAPDTRNNRALFAWWTWTLAMGGCVIIFACRVPLIAQPVGASEADALAAVLILATLLAPCMSHLLTERRWILLTLAPVVLMGMLGCVLSGRALAGGLVPTMVAVVWIVALGQVSRASRVAGVLLAAGGPILAYLSAEFVESAAPDAWASAWAWAWVPAIGVSRAIHPLFGNAVFVLIPPAAILLVSAAAYMQNRLHRHSPDSPAH